MFKCDETQNPKKEICSPTYVQNVVTKLCTSKIRPKVDDVVVGPLIPVKKSSFLSLIVCRPKRNALCKKISVGHKKLSFGKPHKVAAAPRRLHRTQGDGNSYSTAISFCVTCSEEQHQTFTNKVNIHYVEKAVSKVAELVEYEYVNVHGQERQDIRWSVG